MVPTCGDMTPPAAAPAPTSHPPPQEAFREKRCLRGPRAAELLLRQLPPPGAPEPAPSVPRAGLREGPSSPWRPGPLRAPLQSRAPSAHVLGSAWRPTATPGPPRCIHRLSAATISRVSAQPKESLWPSSEQRATPPGEHAPRRPTGPHRTPGSRPAFTPCPAPRLADRGRGPSSSVGLAGVSGS